MTGSMSSLQNRLITWVLPIDQGADLPAWVCCAVEDLQAAGAQVTSLTNEDVHTGDEHHGAVSGADLVIAVGMATGVALVEAGLERARLWTIVQDEPGHTIGVGHRQLEQLRRAVLTSRKVLVFDEDARSVVEGAVVEATSNVLVLPLTNGANQWAIPPAAADRPVVLVIQVNTTGALGAKALRQYADCALSQRDPRPVVLICEASQQAEIRRDSELRELVSIPGAQLVTDDETRLRVALSGFRPLGFLPDAPPGQGHRTNRALHWFQSRGIEVFAEGQSLPPKPRFASSHRWHQDTFVQNLRAAERAPAGVLGYFSGAEAMVELLAPYFPDYGSLPRVAERARVLLVGADFKFAGEYIEALAQRDDIELRVDRWANNSTPQPDHSAPLIDWADVVVCEFSSINALWYSHHLPPHKRLIVHLHGFELLSDWIHQLNISAVDRVVFVSDFYREKAIHMMGWPREKTAVIANPVQAGDLARPKFSDARFHLGMAGYVPELKRPDRALDLMEHLLAEDPRYILHLRGHKPWNYPYVWRRAERRDAYLAFFERLRRSAVLRRSVVFEPFGPDMGNWFRRIGWMLSPSTRETFHLAPVEGMVSGAVPIVWRRVGSEDIFPVERNFDSADQAAELILATRSDGDLFLQWSHEAVNFASRYGAQRVTQAWIDLVLSGGPGHQSGAPDFTWNPSSRTPEERDRWATFQTLAEAKDYGQAASLINVADVRPWEVTWKERRLIAEVHGIPMLRRRSHRLHAAPATEPLVRPVQDAALIVCAEGTATDAAVGYRQLGAAHPQVLRLPTARDDLNMEFDRWVDLVTQRCLEFSVPSIVAAGDEVVALTCTVAASRLGVEVEWDLCSALDALIRLREAAADPYGATDRGVLALMAARHATQLRTDELLSADVPAPLEDLVRPARGTGEVVVAVVGETVTPEDLPDGVGVVRMDVESWAEHLTNELSGILIQAAGLEAGPWARSGESMGADEAAIDTLITFARRRDIPIGLLAVDVEELGTLDKYARRVDAVLTASPEDAGRLHDERIVPAQIAATVPHRGRGGVSATADPLLDDHAQIDLLLRMLRITGT